MSAATIFGVIVWLMLGGWAFRRIGPSTPDNLVAGLAVACVVFAPFAAGVALAEIRPKKRVTKP